MVYVFAGMIGFVALVFSMVHAIKRLKETEATMAKVEARRQAQVERLKRAARGTLGQARELSAMRRRKTAIEIACQEIEERLNATRALDRRLYVLDDRRSEVEQGWIVRIVHPDYAHKVNAKLERTALETWKRGRRFLVWATDEAKARDKVQARFPPNKGFEMQSIERHEG